MHPKWVTNITNRSRANEIINNIESYHGNTCLLGRPHTTGSFSVIELETMNLIGIYMEMLDEEFKPDPDCPDCKGAGTITLFVSISPCKCLE